MLYSSLRDLIVEIALELNQGDIANATSWLREKGKVTATKLAGRVAGEGVIAVAAKDGNGVIVEVSSNISVA